MKKFTVFVILSALLTVQLVGYAMSLADQKHIVDSLNTLFNKVDDTSCDHSSKPYACSGVLIHTDDHLVASLNPLNIRKSGDLQCGLTDRGSNPDAMWCPGKTQIQNGFMSFSYLRKDIMPNNGQVIFVDEKEVGFILDLSYTQKINLLCSYPLDGATLERDQHGCGDSQFSQRSQDEDVSTCRRELQPMTVDNYFSHYGNPPDKMLDMCSIGPHDFNFFIQVARQTKYQDASSMYTENEQVISAWPGAMYKDIPIVAFYYVINDDKNPPAPDVARQLAQMYNQQSGRDVPVVAIDMKILKQSREITNPQPFALDQTPTTCSSSHKAYC